MTNRLGDEEPIRDELFKLYLLCVEDYRFQVTLNWSRAQYYLTLNVSIIGVAVGLVNLGDDPDVVLSGCVFAVGALTALFSILATEAGRGYYLRVIQRKKLLELRLGLDEYAIKTTAGQGGPKRRVTVTQLLKFFFVSLGVIDLVGLGYLVATA